MDSELISDDVSQCYHLVLRPFHSESCVPFSGRGLKHIGLHSC